MAPMDEETLKRWMTLEVNEVNQATVTKGRRLRALMAEDEPAAEMRNGDLHRFDPDTLERLEGELSPMVRANLRLPVTIYLDHDTDSGCYISHDWAIEAVDQLDVLQTSKRDGKLWLSRAKAIQIADEWPTAFQFLLA